MPEKPSTFQPKRLKNASCVTRSTPKVASRRNSSRGVEPVVALPAKGCDVLPRVCWYMLPGGREGRRAVRVVRVGRLRSCSSSSGTTPLVLFPLSGARGADSDVHRVDAELHLLGMTVMLAVAMLLSCCSGRAVRPPEFCCAPKGPSSSGIAAGDEVGDVVGAAAARRASTSVLSRSRTCSGDVFTSKGSYGAGRQAPVVGDAGRRRPALRTKPACGSIRPVGSLMALHVDPGPSAARPRSPAW